MPKIISKKKVIADVCELSLDGIPTYIQEDGFVSHNCKSCMRFWFLPDGITPRVYKLSELMANGSNIGKKQADWLPTVSNTHPNERHLMLEVPIGWGFKGGAISYIGPGHNEYQRQKGEQ